MECELLACDGEVMITSICLWNIRPSTGSRFWSTLSREHPAGCFGSGAPTSPAATRDGVLWSPSYFAASTGGASLWEVVKRYVVNAAVAYLLDLNGEVSGAGGRDDRARVAACGRSGAPNAGSRCSSMRWWGKKSPSSPRRCRPPACRCAASPCAAMCRSFSSTRRAFLPPSGGLTARWSRLPGAAPPMPPTQFSQPYRCARIVGTPDRGSRAATPSASSKG